MSRCVPVHFARSVRFPRSATACGAWAGGPARTTTSRSAALERAIELGCTFFDTALAYGQGKSEQLLGRVLARHRDKRLIVATKIPPRNLKWPALDEYALDDVFSADHIRRSTETSLKNLGLASVDLQQFHVWSDAWAERRRAGSARSTI